MTDPTFTITLADLKALADAMCAVDSLKAYADRDIMVLMDHVQAGHDAVMRTLGPQVDLIYNTDDAPEAVPA